MDIELFQIKLSHGLQQAMSAFQKVPGSAVLLRYIRSSYQNDPVRSAIELILILFFIRYLLSPSYSTHKQNFVKLREDVCTVPVPPLAVVMLYKSPHGPNALSKLMTALANSRLDTQEIDELVDEWVPEPLVSEKTALEEAESERLPVIIG